MTASGLARVDIKSRAAQFAERYKSTTYERGEAQTFYNDFFRVFGVERFGNAVFERYVKTLGGKHHGYIDLLWPKVLLAEHKSVGHDLQKALEQAQDYMIELSQDERPQYMLACDFQNFVLVDLDAKERHEFELAELPDKIDLFDFIRGRKRQGIASQEPVSIKAAEMMGKVYDALKDNGYPEHDAARLLTKLTFCFFADDTGIFSPRGILLDYLENTSDDGVDLGPRLVNLFDILNTAKEKRQKNTSAELNQFEHINGDLFGSSHSIPRFDGKTRAKILKAAKFNWEPVSPAIFGSLFQSVMSPEERRDSGAHYTTEENIMKVVGPLFLDDLRAEFYRIKERKDAGRKKALDKFRKKLADLKFLDPACGAGNFLIVSYKQLRRLELDAIKEMYPPDPRTERFDAAGMPLVNVDQFCGIELNGFSARISEAAMWMMDHLMNNEISSVYGDSYIRLPLKERANILNADALETDWNDVLPSAECSYILGNPPFGGSKMMSGDQRAQVRKIADLGGSGGTLDYVTAWFIKAVKYAPDAPLGLVATNSITQGEQVAQLWPVLLKDGTEIAFAHKSFKWNSDAAYKAHVHVVVIGLARNVEHKRLFDGTTEENPWYISPYLVGANYRTPLVSESPNPLNGLAEIRDGIAPLDDGNFTFTKEAKEEFLVREPQAAKFMRPYIGAKEFINGIERWILYLQDTEPSELRALPEVMKCINRTIEYRTSCNRKQTRKLASNPTKFGWGVIPSNTFLLIPRVSSERREYIPIAYVEPPTIPSCLVMVIQDATPGLFGLLTSKMHMVWLSRIGSRLEERYRYSAGLVYNTFPLPDADSQSIGQYAQAVLDARTNHPGQTLADLYDPRTMPADLRKAHEKLDKAVDRLYRREPFKDDHERLEFLLERYGAMVQNNQKLIQEPKRKRRKAKRRPRTAPKTPTKSPSGRKREKKQRKAKRRPRTAENSAKLGRRDDEPDS